MTNSATKIGYCTNVHAGPDLATTQARLQQHAIGVKEQFSPDSPLGIGLWLSAVAARNLCEAAQIEEFAAWLEDVGLAPFTLNGFPYGDFHQPIVKHDVYKPNWCDAARVDFTFDLIHILDRLLPEGHEGSISTLPLQWRIPTPDSDQLSAAAANLHAVADRLARLEDESGRLIYLCLEPEPGCVLGRAEDVVRFFEDHLFADGHEATARRYMRVCHDICHSAVMFEGQAEALRKLTAAGIRVGKVQVSSAVTVPFDEIAPQQRVEALNQLRTFAEDRYLHQTVIRSSPDADAVFFDDLPNALDAVTDPVQLTGEWRVHFHVPVYLEQFGLLRTSRGQISECLEVIAGEVPDVSHFEVETYAWSVLPRELQQSRLADGIAQELSWFRQLCDDAKPIVNQGGLPKSDQ